MDGVLIIIINITTDYKKHYYLAYHNIYGKESFETLGGS